MKQIIKYQQKITLLAIGIITSLMVVSCSSEKHTEEQNKSSLKVSIVEVEKSEVNIPLEFPGSIQAATITMLSTRLMGQVSAVNVDIGDKVRKGELLLKLRSNDVKAKKAQVEANLLELSSALKNAEKDLKRIKTLHGQKSASDKELDDIETHVAMLNAKKQAAEEMLKEVEELLTYAIIRSPYSGTITSKNIQVGDMANPGMPLLGLESGKGFEVVAKVPEHLINQVHKGTEVEVGINTIPAKRYRGVISQVSTSGANTGTQFEMKVTITDPDIKELRTGMFARVYAEGDAVHKVLIHKDALVEKGQLQAVWTVSQSNKALLRYVRLGKNYDDKIEVLSGLQAGERIIYPEGKRLSNGITVSKN
ncbi:efflux RND transporter periplasmic adaptor subunit [Puteibacter caeruleilacunae]|nr:efflux RND transporter periplasmic adaptor subunit [Puteibacter caeruleilacunae]